MTAYGDIATACEAVLEDIDDLWLGLPLGADDVVPAVRGLLGQPPDLVVHRLPGGTHLVFLDSIVDMQRIGMGVLGLLLDGRRQAEEAPFAARTSRPATFGDAVDALLQGKALLVRPDGRAVALGLENWPERTPSEPPGEIVTQGPHAGFVETLQTNVGMIRQRVRDPDLRWEGFRVGSRVHLGGALLYVRGLVRPDVLRELRRRLQHLQPDFIADASMLQEWLTNVSGALFPTMDSTERPDTAVAALLEGRVVILVEGSPVALLAPAVFANLLHTPQDYYNRSFNALLKRLLRFGALLASLLLTPLFVAVATANQELVPTPVYVSLAQSRLDTPLPMVVEVLAMEIVVELVREAGLRMPGAVGQTISIVGAIVIGQAAVIAGLVSAPVVVVVSLEYIASTAVPSLDTRLSLRMLRFPLIVLASIFGIFGLSWGLMLLLLYLVALESFGVPYLAPVAPRRPHGHQDFLYRRPLTDMVRSFTARGRRRGGG